MNKKDISLLILSRFGFLFSDEQYLKLRFRLEMGRDLNLENPQTFNEKLQWLKLFDRKPEYTKIVDKYAVKEYVANQIGEEYIIPTLGLWEKPEEIDFNSLPKQFVLKTTHGGGGYGVVICKDKDRFDTKRAIRYLKKALKTDIYKAYKEYPYKNVKRRIIAEKYIEDENGELFDYKFSCFNGDADCVMLCLDRATGDTKFYFFDKKWNLLRFNKRGKEAPSGFSLPKPEGMDKMFEIASKLSEGFPFVRTDLYYVNGHIYFGELTFYPASGFDSNLLQEAETYFGDKIKINNK